MKKKTKEMMGMYKDFLLQRQPGGGSDHMTDDGILIETESAFHFRKSAGKEDTV